MCGSLVLDLNLLTTVGPHSHFKDMKEKPHISGMFQSREHSLGAGQGQPLSTGPGKGQKYEQEGTDHRLRKRPCGAHKSTQGLCSSPLVCQTGLEQSQAYNDLVYNSSHFQKQQGNNLFFQIASGEDMYSVGLEE